MAPEAPPRPELVRQPAIDVSDTSSVDSIVSSLGDIISAGKRVFQAHLLRYGRGDGPVFGSETVCGETDHASPPTPPGHSAAKWIESCMRIRAGYDQSVQTRSRIISRSDSRIEVPDQRMMGTMHFDGAQRAGIHGAPNSRKG